MLSRIETLHHFGCADGATSYWFEVESTQFQEISGRLPIYMCVL